MALVFTMSYLVAIILLYAAGWPLLRLLGLPRRWALLCAPAASLLLYSMVGEAYHSMGIAATPLSVALAPTSALAILALLLKRGRDADCAIANISLRHMALYGCVGLIMGLFVFVRQLPSLDATFQSEDIVKHALQIQAFLDAESFTSLHSNVYLAQPDVIVEPNPSGGAFYPSAWHIVCALVAQVTGCTVPLSMNAVNLAFAATVYPLASLVLLRTLVEEDSVVDAGCLASLTLTAFPWAFLVFGPLFPNLAGTACIPIVAALFIQMSSEKAVARDRVTLLLAFLVTAAGMALAHPNAVFSTAVLLIPYCAWVSTWLLAPILPLPKRLRKPLSAVATLFICAAVWSFIWNLPSFYGTVNFNWRSYASGWQGLVNVLSLAFTAGFRRHRFTAQPVVGLALLLGVRKLLHRRKHTWLLWSYAFACIICIVSMSSEGFLKHFLAGFWYTDPFRLAATAAVIAVPLVAFGLKDMADLLAKLHERVAPLLLPTTQWLLSRRVTCYAILLFAIVIPTFTVPGMCTVDTAFTNLRLDVRDEYSLQYPYSPEERAFVEQVKDVIPEGALVINEPLDGSILAYGFDDLRIYYRSRWGYGYDTETQESLLIREHLRDIADNPEVAEAVDSIGAEYVLLLDTEGTTSTWLGHFWHPERFYGITMINDYTPGFELVLSDGRCRLYRIAA